MELELVNIENPDELNLILGHSHFIKTVEDIHEAMVNTIPGAKFGLAFCEASQDRLVRWSGTDDALIELARTNAMKIGAGHSFILFMKDSFPINVVRVLKQVPEVCRIICATANPLQVIVAKTDQGRGIMGVVDGYSPVGIENDEDIKKRKDFLRMIGYKF
jgi:adenosine/AMP kinase